MHRQRDKWRRTPLHRAAKEGHKEVVSALLDSGAEINAQVPQAQQKESTMMSMHILDRVFDLKRRDYEPGSLWVEYPRKILHVCTGPPMFRIVPLLSGFYVEVSSVAVFASPLRLVTVH